MRIVCDKCQTTYIVPDEKITKSVLRLDCQKCGHQIIWRVAELAAESEEGKLGKWRSSASFSKAQSPKSELAAWYYSYNGQSVGPFLEADLVELFVSSRIPKESYVWQASFVEWMPALETEPFRTQLLKLLKPLPPPPPPPVNVSVSHQSTLPPLLKASEFSPTRGVDSRAGSGLSSLKSRLVKTPSVSLELPSPQASTGLESLANLGMQSSNKFSDPLETLTPGSLPEIDLDFSLGDVTEGSGELSVLGEGDDLSQEIEINVEADLAAFSLSSQENERVSRTFGEDIGEIDLDESTQLYSQDEIEAITRAEERESIPILDPELYDSADSHRSVALSNSAELAKVSVRKKAISTHGYDAIKEKHFDLFAEASTLEQADLDYSSQPGESSMLLQIAHLQRAQRKQNRHLLLLAIAVVVVVLLALLGFLLFSKEETVAERSHDSQSYASVTGRFLDEAELNVYAPADDFEIIDALSARKTVAASANSKKGQAAEFETVQDKPKEGLESAKSVDSKEQKADSAVQIPSPVLGRRDGSSIELPNSGFFGERIDSKASKYAGLKKASASDRSTFTSGLKSVSRTVQECHKRELKMGLVAIDKIYIILTVMPDGRVSKFTVEQREVSQNFVNCLSAKKDRWIFQAFEGDSVDLRQGFVLQ